MPKGHSVELDQDRFSRSPRSPSVGPVVLFIGDEPSTASSVLHALQRDGYEVRPLSLGPRTAINLRSGRGVQRQPVELVVLDASRQARLALASLEALRTVDGAIPAIVIADGDAATRAEAARLGADVVLQSPADTSRLRSAARALVPPLPEFDRVVEARGYVCH